MRIAKQCINTPHVFFGAILAAIFAFPSGVQAQETPGSFGVGAFLGVPFGGSFKYMITRDHAVDLTLGAEAGDFDVNMDVLTHLRDLLPQPSRGKLAPYLGLGIKIKDQHSTLFGFRFQGGLSYLVPKVPVEIFGEVAPVLEVTPDVDGRVEGGVGVRYYFGGSAG
jgi:hypothetical protein